MYPHPPVLLGRGNSSQITQRSLRALFFPSLSVWRIGSTIDLQATLADRGSFASFAWSPRCLHLKQLAHGPPMIRLLDLPRAQPSSGTPTATCLRKMAITHRAQKFFASGTAVINFSPAHAHFEEAYLRNHFAIFADESEKKTDVIGLRMVFEAMRKFPQFGGNTTLFVSGQPPAISSSATTGDTAVSPSTIPIPKPTSPLDTLPDQSSYLMSLRPADLFIHAIAPPALGIAKGQWEAYYNVAWLRTNGIQEWVARPAFPDPPLPNQLYLERKNYWKLIVQRVIVGPQTFSYTDLSKAGMSTTKVNILSSELGISIEGLSSKASQVFQSSVTITTEEDITNAYQVPVAAGTTVVWALWQWVEEYRICNEAFVEINYRGSCTTLDEGHIDFDFPATSFENPSRLFHAEVTPFSSHDNSIKNGAPYWVSVL